MAQRQYWRSSGEQAWLALLVDTFDTISRDPMTSADAASISALKTQLARPQAAAKSKVVAFH